MKSRGWVLVGCAVSVFAAVGASAQDTDGELTAKDYIDIEQLSARYIYAVENCTNGGYDYADLYTDDGEFGVAEEWGAPPGRWRFRAAGRDELAIAAGGGPDGCRDPETLLGYGIHHVITAHAITPTAAGATGRSTLLAIGVGGNPTTIEYQGGYEDVYVKTAEGWRFKSRVHVFPNIDESVQFGSTTPEGQPFFVERLDPAIDEIVAPDAELELLGDRFGLTEGPVWVNDDDGGYLLFSDLIANVIWKWAPEGELSVFLDGAGYSGDDFLNAGTQTRRGRMHVIMIGPNGLTLDPRGRLVYCAPPDGAIMRLEPDGTRTVLADNYQGMRFNGPNDVVSASNGDIYFTDSDFGLRGGRNSPQKELPFNGVYLVRDGEAQLLLTDEELGGFPNGIALSPDERYMYLNAGFERMMRYEVQPDGTIANGTVFFEGGGGIVDGMKTDLQGNLYSTGGAGPGEVRITSPEGDPLGRIHLPVPTEEPRPQVCATNVAFGDPDGKGLYITACEHVYRMRLETPGVLPGL